MDDLILLKCNLERVQKDVLILLKCDLERVQSIFLLFWYQYMSKRGYKRI